jgi:RimJ/RimL family protein N-acetyltransferase
MIATTLRTKGSALDRESVVRLSDGTALRLRPLEDGERGPMIEVFEHMSRASRYLRFFSPMPRLNEPMLRQLSRVDGIDRVAWAAFRDEECVGIVQFVRLPHRPEAAEIAISIVDALHGRGLGRVLLGVLAAAAYSADITTFTMTVHPDNRRSLALMRSCGAPLRLVEGSYEGQLPISALLADERIRRQVDLAALVRRSPVPSVPAPRAA